MSKTTYHNNPSGNNAFEHSNLLTMPGCFTIKRVATRGRQLCSVALLLLLAFNGVSLQAQTSGLNVTVYRDLVRFTVPEGSKQVRVEISSPVGVNIFDSGFVTARTQDWLLQDINGNPIGSGMYSYAITVKDQSGNLIKVGQGNVIVNKERLDLQTAPSVDVSVDNQPQTPQTDGSHDFNVDLPSKPYSINTPAMGVGTANPLARLHVGNGTTSPVTVGSSLLIGDGAAAGVVLKSDAGGEMFLYQDKMLGLFGTVSDHPFGIRTNNLNRLWISRDGKVGINTVNPSSPLTVDGMIEVTKDGIKFPDGTIQTTAAIGGSIGGPGAPAGPAQEHGPETDKKKDVTLSGVDGDWTITGNADINPNTNFLGTINSNPLIFKTSSQEAMRIDPSGKVGIGTPVPVERFDLALGRLRIGGQCGGPVPDVQGAYISWNQVCGLGETDFINHQGLGGGGFAFMNRPRGANAPLSTLMFISGGGGVGIGTETRHPTQMLDVNGNIKMSGVRTKLFYRGDVNGHIGSLGLYSPDGGRTAVITPYDSNGANLANSTIRLGGFGSFESNAVNLQVSGRVGIGTRNRNQLEWSLFSSPGNEEFGVIDRPLNIWNERLGASALTIGSGLNITTGSDLTVRGSLFLTSNRTAISGFDNPNGTGFHWFGRIFDTDLAFGIRRLSNNKYEFHFNGPIFKRGGGVSFVEDHPTDSTKEIIYVALEGPENGTYTRGSAKIVDGVAVVDLPDHFSMVTSDNGITVQLTSKGEWLKLYVSESNAKQIVIREGEGKSGAFDYLVQGVRKGYENHQVIRDKNK